MSLFVGPKVEACTSLHIALAYRCVACDDE